VKESMNVHGTVIVFRSSPSSSRMCPPRRAGARRTRSFCDGSGRISRGVLACLLALQALQPAMPNVPAFCPSAPSSALGSAPPWPSRSPASPARPAVLSALLAADARSSCRVTTAPTGRWFPGPGRGVRPGAPAVHMQARGAAGESGPPASAPKTAHNTSAEERGPRPAPGLPDLRQLRDSNQLLEVVGRFVVNGTDWMLSPEDAAVSLHFLYRAARGAEGRARRGAGALAEEQGQRKLSASPFVVRRRQNQAPASAQGRGGGQPRARASSAQGSHRLEDTMVVLSAAIARDMRRADSALQPRHLSMALTAVSDRVQHRAVFKDLFYLASKRVQDIVRARTSGHLRTRGGATTPGKGQGVQPEPHRFTAQTISMLATAFVKSEIADPTFFEALAQLLKQMSPERFSARPVGMILKSFARANALARDAELLRILCSVVAAEPIEDFDAQSCTDIVFALARVGQQGRARGWEGDARDEALQHVVAAIIALPPQELAGGAAGGSAQGASMLAALCSALVSARVTDALVFDKLSVAWQAIDPKHWNVQTIATMMHAFASAGHRDQEMMQALTNQLLRTPLRAVEARAAANIAWCAAVQESRDPALLCWIWRSLDLLLPSMQADGLSQVHQFLLYAQIGNFTREDVFTAFYGTRVTPPAVRQTLNDMEESAEQRCRREFIRESRAQCLAQRSSRLHEHVSSVLVQVAPSVLPSLRLVGASEDRADAHPPTRGLRSGDVPAMDSQTCPWLQHEFVDSVSGYSIDMLIPDHSIAIEVDGCVLSLSLSRARARALSLSACACCQAHFCVFCLTLKPRRKRAQPSPHQL